MKADLRFSSNQLLLNPRLPEAVRDQFARAWRDLVEPRYVKHVGITTSGSSGGIGRLILLSKDALESSARAVNERFESTAKDVWMKSLPSFHVGGLGILVRAKLSGASVYEDKSEKWNVQEFDQQVRSAKATLISLVPTQVYDLVQAKVKSPSHVRAVIVGGGRLEQSLRQSALELGWPCLPSYGMTETCSQIATAVSTSEPDLVLLSHAEVKSRTDGRLCIKGPSLLTAQIEFGGEGEGVLTDPKIDGWFIAEDHGRVDGRTLKIEGRTIDFVKIAGEGVALARLEVKLEQVKLASAFLGDAVLLAVKDDRLGAKLVLVTDAETVDVASPVCYAASAEELVLRFNAEVAPFERIREIKRVDRVPRSPLGKLLRAEALKLIGMSAPLP